LWNSYKQPWVFIVLQDKEKLKKLYESYKLDWIKTAPAVIAVCGDHRQAWRRSDGKIHTDIDVAIAIDHMTLAATDLGLATCWVCKFDVMKIVDVLQLRDDIEPIALLPIGYSDDNVDVENLDKKRKPKSEVVHYERFFYKDFKR
jgi:nitroreductase